ncbi:hypothetical protein PY650_24090 [Rhizobium calliandrae]|uniref:DUF4239 domain-containing protein n=1 Tax=Rhizobium calliandrae TaxID=1312182 RepID=A0ABT7KJD1_9HYPH|nr:hypothetical protein [Rhizobium calliandrae]MDL2408667.1 hypothetical protein [Rhizobium calliandrae]
MGEIQLALVAFGLLGASAALGFFLRQRLSDQHLSDHNIEALRLVTGLLVTFTALVLSLLLASVKASFDTTDRDRRMYAASLAAFDQCLQGYGAETAAMRAVLREYTAGVIASTWPDEEKPTGVVLPDLAGVARVGEDRTLKALITGVGLSLAALDPKDAFHQNQLAACRLSFDDVMHRREAVIEDAQGTMSGLFSRVLMFWLMLVFISFGLQARHNRFTVVAIGIGALAISTVIFVIADLDKPYGGVFGIPSTSMRNALEDMLR